MSQEQDLYDIGPLDPNMPPVPEDQLPTPPMADVQILPPQPQPRANPDHSLYLFLNLHLSSDILPDLTDPQSDMACEGSSVVIAVIGIIEVWV